MPSTARTVKKWVFPPPLYYTGLIRPFAPSGVWLLRVMDDSEFLKRFEDLSLPFAQWTHQAHVKVGFLYLQAHPFQQALAKLRKGIKAYNAANKVPESATSGYNETTTHAFLHLIAATMAAYGDAMPTPTADAFCDTHLQLMTRNALRFFYSPARRMDPRAKTEFVPPDLAPLPSFSP